MKAAGRRIVVVGAGMSGLTAAAYLSREGQEVLLIEKNSDVGGLLNSFKRDGYLFDAGPRSLINSGIVRPMIRQLGIDLELLPNVVSVGIEDEVIRITSKDSLKDYERLLKTMYPESIADIDTILSKIKAILKHMAVLYGIDNPNFKDLKNDKQFLVGELLPWFPKFLFSLYKMNRMNEPLEDFLGRLSADQSLMDIIAQHFFKKTPSFFALGYFYVYLDYLYPRNGTGELPRAMKQKILDWGGTIQADARITEVVPSEKTALDAHGRSYRYDRLVWCADLKTLYRCLKTDGLNPKVKANINKQKDLLLSKHGAESVFTLFLGVEEDPETFRSVCSEHFFYTPSRKGLGETHRSDIKKIIDDFPNKTQKEILRWLDAYCELTTYEISIPALRQKSLAPEGKTGLIISFLFEYELMKKIRDAGWYEEFKTEVEDRMVNVLSRSIYPGLKGKVRLRFSSTPISLFNRVGSSEGAIIGWSYETGVPAVSNLRKIASSVKTPVPGVLQAGQWTFSPAGIPTAILTGSFAAHRILKNKS